MENEIKELISYMRDQKEKLLHLYEERKELKEEKDRIDDKDSGFYQDAEQEYNDKVTEYDSIVAETKAVISEKKADIIERLEKDKKVIDKYRKEYKSEYVELSLMHEEIIRKREQLEGAQAHLKWLKATLPDTVESNRETISKAESRVAELEEEFNENIRIVNLIPEGKNAKETYLELQEKIKSIEKLNMNNFEEIVPELVAEETKPEETKPEETKPEETKLEETKPGETKTEETKPEGTKPVGTKPVGTKPVGGIPVSGIPVSRKSVGANTIADNKRITINAEIGYVIYDEIKNGVHYGEKIDLDKVFSDKNLNKKIIEMLDKDNDKKYIKILKSRLKSIKLNPAILTTLKAQGEIDDLKEYIDIVFDKEKSVNNLPFEYTANLQGTYFMKDSTLNKLNRTLLRDNKDLGTEFPATKYLSVKKVLNKIPFLSKSAKKWIGLLPEASVQEKVTPEQENALKAAKYAEYKYAEYMGNKYATREANGPRRMSTNYKQFVKAQDEFIKTEDAKTAFSNQMDPNNPIYDKNRPLDSKSQRKVEKRKEKNDNEMTL